MVLRELAAAGRIERISVGEPAEPIEMMMQMLWKEELMRKQDVAAFG